MIHRIDTLTMTLCGALALAACSGGEITPSEENKAGSPPALATHHSRIEGIVIDSTGSPVDSIWISVRLPDDDQAASQATIQGSPGDTTTEPSTHKPVTTVHGRADVAKDGTFSLNAQAWIQDIGRVPSAVVTARLDVVRWRGMSRYPGDPGRQLVVLEQRVISLPMVPIQNVAPTQQLRLVVPRP